MLTFSSSEESVLMNYRWRVPGTAVLNEYMEGIRCFPVEKIVNGFAFYKQPVFRLSTAAGCFYDMWEVGSWK